MIRISGVLCIGAASLLFAAMANAQVPWETPHMLGPHAPRGVGIHAASFAAAPGDGWGVVLSWRNADAPTGLGFRIAGGEGRAAENAVGAGIDVSGWIVRASQTLPLDVIWTTGLGGSYGRSAQIALPVGIAAGRSIEGERMWFSPYASARAIIEGRFGGRTPDDEIDLQLTTEIGANFAFDRNRSFVLRLAAAMGDRSAFAIGAHVGAGRKNVVTATRGQP